MQKKILLTLLTLVLTMSACGSIDGASFSFSKDNLELSVGETFTVDLILNSEQDIDAVDALVRFNNEFLTVERTTKGTIFEIYPLKTTDNDVGLVKISAASRSNFFSGNGTYATLIFKAVKNGDTTVTYEYEEGKNSHKDTDVMSQGVDLLSKVKALKVSIK